jgi:DNA invertase Pin-like site-specific DNA recombinase
MKARIGASHLERRASVYIRQSTMGQVHDHGESTQRQYALADRAVALGWARGSVEVIDEDLGRSGASTEGRSGFARLVEGVARGEVGAVLAIEVSRLARSSYDWQRLLALCAVADVAVIDEQAIYDPGDKDDKLLLDIKGTMSEAELQWLALRLTGARQSKARRGELRIPVPTGYVWNDSRLELDPDETVQRAVRLVFERYAIEASAWGVVRWARDQGLRFPTRHRHGGGLGEVSWKPLGMTRMHELLRNPIYAGVYAYSRRPSRKTLVNGEIRQVRATGRDPETWGVRIEGAHAGYITWETFVKNQKKLQDNLNRLGRATRGAPREGSALLAGLLLCGRCGHRLGPSYGSTGKNRCYYSCGGDRDKAQRTCWTVPGAPLDFEVEKLFLETMVPSELELCLAVEHEASRQADGLGEQWRLRLEKTQYEARCAERRYKAVDPENRVVARTLERQWEERLGELAEVEREYERAKAARHVDLSAEDRAQIRAIAKDLPRVWRSETTALSDRKAMLRLAIEAISVVPIEVPRRATRMRVQWTSGAVSEIEIARPARWETRATPATALARLRELAAAGLHDAAIAERLNAEGHATGTRPTWTESTVRWTRSHKRIERVAPDLPRTLRLPDRHADGRYSVAGAAKRCGVTADVVRGWITRGLVTASREPYAQYRSTWWIQLDDNALPAARGAVRPNGAA